MEINNAGIELIKRFEGFRSKRYLCPAGIPTIGYGATRWFDGGPIPDEAEITEAQGRELLERDVGDFGRRVGELVVTGTTENQFSALVSFSYNVGSGNFQRSTLLKKHNAGDTNEAATEFLRWCYAGGKRLVGLYNRRVAERKLYLSEGGDKDA